MDFWFGVNMVIDVDVITDGIFFTISWYQIFKLSFCIVFK